MPSIELAALCALLVPSVIPQEGLELRWRSGDTVVLGAPGAEGRVGSPDAQPSQPLSELLEGLAGRHVLIAFERVPSAHDRELLAAAGLELGTPLGRGAYHARVTGTRIDAAVLGRFGGWVDARALETSWKLDAALRARPPRWAVVDRGRDTTVAVHVVLHADVELERGQTLLESLGGGVFDVLESSNALVAHVPFAQTSALAAADEVAWVEPVLPPFEGLANDSNRALTGVDAVQSPPYGLDGSGVCVLVYDSAGANAAHVDLASRVTNHEPSVDAHASHVAGIIAGDGANSAGQYRGMAPGAEIHSYGFTFDSSGFFLFTNPGDLEADYLQGLVAHGADFANNSIGMNIENRGFPCTLQGDYGVMSNLLDAITRGSLGEPLPVLWANGNERIGPRCDVPGFEGFWSVPPPATAKNPIAVGAVNSNDDSMTFFSSWGPTDDGRMKPDVSAPGCQTSADFAVTSTACCGATGYHRLCGTSMATPTTTGILALALEDHRARGAGPDPRNATWKALLAHTAVDRGDPGPDYRFGYGSVRAPGLIEQMRAGRHLEDTVTDQDERVAFEVVTTTADPELRLTLAWDDAPASPSVRDTLVNDLDLVVIDPTGARHFPWSLDPADPAAPAVRTRPNALDIIEQVLVPDPAPGSWRIEVRGRSLPAGPQPFGLVSSHDLALAPFVRLSFPTPLPVLLESGQSTAVTVRVQEIADAVVPGSLLLHARYDGQTVLSFPMQAIEPGSELHTATLPAPACAAEPEYWFSVEGVQSGPLTSPAEAPLEVFQALVASETVVLTEGFEQESGWFAVDHFSLADGGWERGVPAGDGVLGEPYEDYDGSGSCWLTGNRAGDSDVEGGPTSLYSPVFQLSEPGEYEISFAWWFVNDTGDGDELVLELSGDGGDSWVRPWWVGQGGPGRGWSVRSLVPSEHVRPGTDLVLRFDVSDPGQDSVTEAAIDAFRIVRRHCAEVPDCNRNGIDDADDIASGRSLDGNADGVPDECQ